MKRTEYQKEYYTKNRDKILARSRVLRSARLQEIRARDREYYRVNKEKILPKKLEMQKEKVASNKITVINAYGGFCDCCGEAKTEFLCIDHINGGGTQERNAGMKGAKFYRHLIKNNFPPGYRVLCHNCNFSIGIYGYCPHEKK